MVHGRVEAGSAEEDRGQAPLSLRSKFVEGNGITDLAIFYKHGSRIARGTATVVARLFALFFMPRTPTDTDL